MTRRKTTEEILSSKFDDIKIKINVDTSELDAAIEKAKELIQLTEQADKLLCKEVRN